jgi:2-phosphosulfolactate phosphatase
VQDAACVLMGCLRNRAAVTRAALDAGRRGEGMCVVCAGREGRFSLDDAYTAGAIVAAMATLDPGLCLTDGAAAAQRLYQTAGDTLALFRQTRAGRNVIDIGLAEDLEYCAQVDLSSCVPRLGDRVQMMAE